MVMAYVHENGSWVHHKVIWSYSEVTQLYIYGLCRCVDVDRAYITKLHSHKVMVTQLYSYGHIHVNGSCVHHKVIWPYS